ncbi:MAG: hypothetical protein SGARI_003826 [Bacillariaceae sp.]
MKFAQAFADLMRIEDMDDKASVGNTILEGIEKAILDTKEMLNILAEATRAMEDKGGPSKILGRVLVPLYSRTTSTDEALDHASKKQKLEGYEEKEKEILLDGSIRWIAGSRYEIFVANNPKGSYTFDTILAPLVARYVLAHTGEEIDPDDVKTVLVGWLESRARKVRLGQFKDYLFSTLSLIVSFGRVHMQPVHVDIKWPLVQFGVLVTEKAKSTMYKLPDKTDLSSMEQLRLALTDMAGGEAKVNGDIDLKKGLEDFMNAVKEASDKDKDKCVESFIDGFVELMASWNAPKMREIMEYKTLERGEGLVLSGSAVHAGPPFGKNKDDNGDEMRAVLFFTGRPKDCAEYDPDFQLISTQAVGELMADLFRFETLKSVDAIKFGLYQLANIGPHYQII